MATSDTFYNICQKISELEEDKINIGLALTEKGVPGTFNYLDDLSAVPDAIKSLPDYKDPDAGGGTEGAAPTFSVSPYINTEKYIKFWGDDYINLGSPMKSKYDFFICHFSVDNNYTLGDVFGLWGGEGLSNFSLSVGSYKATWYRKNYNGSKAKSIYNKTFYNAYLSSQGMMINNTVLFDTSIPTNPWSDAVGNYSDFYNIYLGNSNYGQGNLGNYFLGYIYRFIWFTETGPNDKLNVVMDLQPAKDNNKYCFYDNISGLYFHSNNGYLTGNV